MLKSNYKALRFETLVEWLNAYPVPSKYRLVDWIWLLHEEMVVESVVL